ncbi:helix-turn-helix domain-containing protein, partial [Ruthenibacterium lactatiformans]
MSSFSAVFKDLRLKKGWSQQRLADELRISKSSV